MILMAGLATRIFGFFSVRLQFEAQHADDAGSGAQCFQQLAGGSVSTSITVTARVRSLVRLRAMLAMLTAALPKRAADDADDAGAVVVFDKQEAALRGGFDIVAGDVDDAGGLAVEGAGDGADLVALDGGNLDQLGAVGGERDGGLGDLEAEGFGDGGGVDEVDLGFVVGAGEEAGEGGAGDQFGVEFGNRAEVGHADGIALGGGDVGEQLAERVGEIQVRADAFERAAVEIGHVHGVADLAGERGNRASAGRPRCRRFPALPRWRRRGAG